MKNDKAYSTEGSAWRLLTRREFLKLSLAAAGTLSLPLLAGCLPEEDLTTPLTSTAAPVSKKFLQPKEIRSDKNHVLATSLLVKFKPMPAQI